MTPLFALPTLLHAADTRSARKELEQLVARALENSPLVGAARARVLQELTRQDENFAFFEPSLSGLAGTAERDRGIPGGTGFATSTNNATVVQGGIEAPVRPGAYVSAGAAERFLREPGGHHSSVFQTLVGMQVRIPLLRDRGFVQWDLKQAQTIAEYNAAVSRLLTVMQNLRHDVEQRYVNVQAALASYTVAQEATARFQSLLDEAKQLAELKVVPEYQLWPAKMELLLRQEAELDAMRLHEVSQIRLQELLGDKDALELKSGPEALVALADEVKVPVLPKPDEIVPFRGIYRELLDQEEVVDAQLRQTRDELRPDVSLNLRATYQGEDPTTPIAVDRVTSDKHLGANAVIVWKQPLGFRAERARIRRHKARLEELRQELRRVEQKVAADMEAAAAELAKARERLALISQAVNAAQQTLVAEQERFRLGEGRSRNVLDAQKDLTNVLQRQMRTAAILLRAHSDYQYAIGYSN
ncbi:MAG: TolC family protein [Lentisphaerae bacterium]|jgi:outer membrane protein TolC|nr:TolC family protein [Lentisphaerota bacterium]MBT4820082.1 TolC family protein [Lentisphaerota bacterium]MBT5604680.1 TolC family protein [Lentisphaerota bacterium]MBT7053820.1 TolC family protein [Lentisphaerota bacterium]MBT7847199.1 TolC family protein [Lentisphaerota bacterium]